MHTTLVTQWLKRVSFICRRFTCSADRSVEEGNNDVTVVTIIILILAGVHEQKILDR